MSYNTEMHNDLRYNIAKDGITRFIIVIGVARIRRLGGQTWRARSASLYGGLEVKPPQWGPGAKPLVRGFRGLCPPEAESSGMFLEGSFQ
jgi:hypothetical protein